MRLPFVIALRYLFGKKSQNVINVISLISVAGVMTGTLALLVVLSVFNGLHGLIGTLYGAFDPDLRVEPIHGKVMSLDTIPSSAFYSHPGVQAVSQVVTDQALLRNGKRQMPAMVLGVDSLFEKVSGIDSIMTDGSFMLHNNQVKMGVFGFILADQMSVGINFVNSVGIYAPRRQGNVNMMNPESSFLSDFVMPSGIFAVKQIEYDSQYLIIGIDQARRLFDYDSTVVSSLFLKVKPGYDVARVKRELIEKTGNKLKIKNKEEQHEAFFKMMKVEKLMAYLILSFILMIATFNVIGTLSMLIFEKKESIFTLKSMGADQQMVTRVFLFEGWLISLVGVIAGLALGIILVLAQQYFGFVKFQGGEAFVVDGYPVGLKFRDVILVFVTVTTIGFLAAWYPVTVIVRRYYSSSKE
jgi:ABC-type lipoprotein release transport system permease subunit